MRLNLRGAKTELICSLQHLGLLGLELVNKLTWLQSGELVLLGIALPQTSRMLHLPLEGVRGRKHRRKKMLVTLTTQSKRVIPRLTLPLRTVYMTLARRLITTQTMMSLPLQRLNHAKEAEL